MEPEKRIGIGAALAGFAAIAVLLSTVFGWSGACEPWSFLLGLLFGVLLGLGATLALAGLVEVRRRR
jgi:predicted ABC-type sugar transport system permease subunit